MTHTDGQQLKSYVITYLDTLSSFFWQFIFAETAEVSDAGSNLVQNENYIRAKIIFNFFYVFFLSLQNTS